MVNTQPDNRQANPGQSLPPKDLRPRQEIRLLEVFRRAENWIWLSNILILIVLSFLVWIGLYFLFLPLAQALE